MRGEFPVSNAGIRAAYEFLESGLTQLGHSRTVVHRMCVILDEHCANMIRHDSTLTEDTRFSVDLTGADRSPKLIITDAGQAFNPLEYAAEGHAALGGQGLNVIRGLADRASYARIESENQLSIEIDEA